MNDDELRRVLHAEADRVEVGSDSWSRLESRLHTARARSAPRAFALGGIAVAVAVALVVGMTWIGSTGRSAHPAAQTRNSMPARIVAVTRYGDLVILDSRSGRLIRTLAHDVATFRGSPELGVAADGRTIYYTDVDGTDQGPTCPGGQEHVVKVPTRGGAAATVGLGRTVALSPDGSTIAFSRDQGACHQGPGALVVRSVNGEAEHVYAGVAGRDSEVVLDHLSWAPDGRHLAFQWLKGTSYAYVLNTKTATSINQAVCICRQRDAVGWFGYLGDTGEFLGSWTPGGKPKAFEKVPFGRSQVVALRADGSVRRTLFAVRGQVEDLASDRGGDHVLAVAAEGGRTFSLSRWTRGDTKPIKIRDGIIAAAWIPDRDLAIAPSTLLVRVSKTRARPGDRLTLAVAVAVDIGEGSVSWTPDPLLLEHRLAGRWDLASSVPQRTFEAPTVGRPGIGSGFPRTRFTVPRVKPGRYRICSVVSIQSPDLSGQVKVCASMTIVRG